jgi:hypothetical protein
MTFNKLLHDIWSWSLIFFSKTDEVARVVQRLERRRKNMIVVTLRVRIRRGRWRPVLGMRPYKLRSRVADGVAHTKTLTANSRKYKA